MGSKRPAGSRPPTGRGRTPRGTAAPGRGRARARTTGTVGTASSRPPVEASTDPRPRRRGGGLTGRAVVLVLVVASLVVSYASSLRAWVDQRSEIAAMQAEVAAREQRVAELEAELRRWKDPAYVAAQARERFGWVMPGEIGYVVVDEDGHTPGRDRPDGTGKKDPPPWWQTLWGSVEAAGKPVETEQEQSKSSKQPKPAETIRPMEQ